MADKKVDNVFAVERLIKAKEDKGKKFYLVKWKGWSTRHNTWEPEENILDAALLADFEERSAKAEAKKAEKAAKANSNKRRSTAKKEKTTPEAPPSKRPRRLAGGEIREESSESSEHDEGEEAPSTSGVGAEQEEEQHVDTNGTEDHPPEPVDDQDLEEIVEDPIQEEPQQDEQERLVDLVDEDTENDETDPENGHYEEQVGEEGYEEQADSEGIVHYGGEEDSNDGGVVVGEDRHFVGHMTQMAMDTFAFIVDLPPDAETKTSQQQMQVLETVMRTEEGEEKMKRIEEIKNELKDSYPYLIRDEEESPSSSSNSSLLMQASPMVNMVEVEFNNTTVEIAEF